MDVAKVILEFLQTLISWPAVTLIIVGYFLRSQRDALARLIGRIKAISFPGGGVEAERVPYEKVPLLSLTPSDETAGKVLTQDLPKSLKTLEEDFYRFIWNSLQAYRVTIDGLINFYWQSRVGAFARLKYGNAPPTLKQKIEDLKTSFNSLAYKDLLEFLEATEQPSAAKPSAARKQLLDLHVKAQHLLDYLRGLGTRP